MISDGESATASDATTSVPNVDSVQRARIGRIVHDRGFLFAVLPTGGADVFVHRSDCEGFATLQEGDQVELRIITPQPIKGRRGHLLRPVSR